MPQPIDPKDTKTMLALMRAIDNIVNGQIREHEIMLLVFPSSAHELAEVYTNGVQPKAAIDVLAAQLERYRRTVFFGHPELPPADKVPAIVRKP